MQHSEHDQKVDFFLARKLALSKRYLTLTQRMAAIGDVSQLPALTTLLTQRKQCADHINEADRALERLFKTATRNHFETARRRLALHLEPILTTIAETEQRFTAWLKDEHRRHKTELLRLRKNRQAVRGYGIAPVPAARCLDTFR